MTASKAKHACPFFLVHLLVHQWRALAFDTVLDAMFKVLSPPYVRRYKPRAARVS
jgi:hypothetical protein